MRHSSSITRILVATCLFCGPGSAQLIPLPPDQLPVNHPASPAPPAPAPPAPAVQPVSIATVALQGVSISGSLSVENGRATIGNNGTITAGDKTAQVDLTRGGTLSVCASTKIHLSTDNTIPGADGALMVAMDRGAIEAHYAPSKYSDVLLTPDLRILISGPGQADLSLRVNSQGDTCVDNHGDHAPYVLASNLFEGGAYRVQPNQRVLFEHGSLREVVDNEKESCGCPAEPKPPLSVAGTGAPGTAPATAGQPVAPTKAEAENPFPLAESEGLKPLPPQTDRPAAPAGQARAQVEAPLVYDSHNPEALPPEPPPAAETPSAPSATAPSAPVARTPPAKPHPGFFRHIGRFFKKLFGG